MSIAAPLCGPARPTAVAAALAALLMIAACSSGVDEAPAAGSPQAAAAPATAWPLLDDDGQVMPSDPAAELADPGARTRAGRYATSAQADQMETALAGGVISTRVDSTADGAGAVDLAVLAAYGMQAAYNLDQHAPVLVRGADLRLASVVANRLHENGYTRVFMVTP